MAIKINTTEGAFVLSGDLGLLVNNRKAKISLKRLGYKEDKNSVLIPYEENSQVPTLQDIERLLNKFFVKFEHGEDIKDDLSAYRQEQGGACIHYKCYQHFI